MQAPLDFQIFTDGGDPATVAVCGELDTGTAPLLRDQLRTLIDQRQGRIVIDLSAVSFIDSSALGVLVECVGLARGEGGDIELANPTASVRRIFEITGLIKALTLAEPRLPPPAA